MPTHLAKSVEADRLKFCDEPSFDAVPFLSTQLRDVFVNPLNHAEAPEEELRPPKVSVRCSAKERLRLLEKLDGSGRLRSFRGKDEVLQWDLCSPKRRGSGQDGARRPSPQHAGGCDMSMDQLFGFGVAAGARLFAEKGEELRMFAEDLREFYHAFLISVQRTRRNALASGLSKFRISGALKRSSEEKSSWSPVWGLWQWVTAKRLQWDRSFIWRSFFVHEPSTWTTLACCTAGLRGRSGLPGS